MHRVYNWRRQWRPTPVLLPGKSQRTGEPGGLWSMGSLRVGHDWMTSLLLFTFMHWSRTWQPTPVFLPGESQGWGSLVGCRLWGCTELDTTEVTWQQQEYINLKYLKYISATTFCVPALYLSTSYAFSHTHLCGWQLFIPVVIVEGMEAHQVEKPSKCHTDSKFRC